MNSFDGGGRLVFFFSYLFLGVSLAPISNTIIHDANHFGRYMGKFLIATNAVHFNRS